MIFYTNWFQVHAGDACFSSNMSSGYPYLATSVSSPVDDLKRFPHQLSMPVAKLQHLHIELRTRSELIYLAVQVP
jgi:hypothetical protein